MKVLTEERQRIILRRLEHGQIVKSKELAGELHASESTIRRDLTELEEAGLLTRIHGGAKKKATLGFEDALSEKSLKNKHAKEAIARTAVQLIAENEYIYLDAGTTTLEMIPYLKSKQIHVVTNGIKQAALLANENISAYILGGSIKLATQAVTGISAYRELSAFRFDRVFLGMNSVDAASGYSTPDDEEAQLKRLALTLTKHAYVLADASKMRKMSFCQVAPLKQAVLICDRLPSELARKIEKQTTLMEALL